MAIGIFNDKTRLPNPDEIGAVLGKDQVTQALEAPLGAHIGGLLRETPQPHDGRWLFIPVKSAADVADIEQLLLIKKRPKQARNSS